MMLEWAILNARVILNCILHRVSCIYRICGIVETNIYKKINTPRGSAVSNIKYILTSSGQIITSSIVARIEVIFVLCMVKKLI